MNWLLVNINASILTKGPSRTQDTHGAQGVTRTSIHGKDPNDSSTDPRTVIQENAWDRGFKEIHWSWRRRGPVQSPRGFSGALNLQHASFSLNVRSCLGKNSIMNEGTKNEPKNSPGHFFRAKSDENCPSLRLTVFR